MNIEKFNPPVLAYGEKLILRTLAAVWIIGGVLELLRSVFPAWFLSDWYGRHSGIYWMLFWITLAVAIAAISFIGKVKKAMFDLYLWRFSDEELVRHAYALPEIDSLQEFVSLSTSLAIQDHSVQRPALKEKLERAHKAAQDRMRQLR